ncbi:mediator of RNA polymerase II transcription subunit 1-like isoform X9 [Myiozetetes cayanensis]|uniref:mediator of RNA polymerase II transcription subunit 1-like isoform X9 n=1 Tax=Myiozetetes cayanensis TaxID=478635 RepID=UPI00215E1110|nr:mediator of RNA polymerase II transcription subunit 1-like isoform X9 [Myiozetetes cayanensis]
MSVPPACQLIPALESRRGVSCRGVVTAISTNALMEQLCLKYQQRPWTETLRLVYFCMDNPLRRPVSHAPDSPLLSCMEKIERTLHAKSMFSVMNALESLSRQKGLNVHVSPSGTSCYITSTMFYLEAQLGKDGNVMDVKLAHFGEAPMVCDDLVQLLRMKNYDAFGKILEDLSNMYQIPGNSEIKAKGYLALKALEKDLYSMSLLDRTQDVNRVTEILHGKVGHLVPRTGGTPMNIEFYISPYQILEAELNPGSQVCGTKTVVTVEGSDMLHKLPLSPLIVDPQSGEDSNPAFLQLTDELTMDLPALFVLKFHQPVPMSSSSIEDIQRLTDDSELLYFEVVPHRNTSFCVFFLHPVEENLACVIIDVITSREVHCHVQLNPQDPALNCSDDFIARAVKRCMSVPVVMRAIFRNAAKVKADSETQDMDVDTKQPHEPPSEQITDSNSLKESPSVAGQHDLVVTDKPSITESTEENLSTAKLETLDDSMEKSNLSPRTETLCRAEEN